MLDGLFGNADWFIVKRIFLQRSLAYQEVNQDSFLLYRMFSNYSGILGITMTKFRHSSYRDSVINNLMLLTILGYLKIILDID